MNEKKSLYVKLKCWDWSFLMIFFTENYTDCTDLLAPNHLMSTMLIAEMSDHC